MGMYPALALGYYNNLSCIHAVHGTSVQQTCDMDQMANSVNPNWLRDCTQNTNCTQLTCQTNGVLENFFGSITFIDVSCLTLPAMRIVFTQDNGREGPNILVTESQVVTSTNHGIGGILTIVVVAQSTVGHSVNITVRNSFILQQ